MREQRDETGTITRRTFGTSRAVLAALLLALVAVVTLTGCAAAQHRDGHPAGSVREHAALTPSRAHATARHTFDPYTAGGRLTVPVVRHTTGSCWSTSIADPTGSAFRCFAGNQILDPCFARPGTAKGDTVACVADPWSKATVLKLTKALPRTSLAAHRVWAFVRSDGATCVAATGTVPAVAGRNLGFNCSDHTFAALNGTRAEHVSAVFATGHATRLRTAAVRDLWHS